MLGCHDVVCNERNDSGGDAGHPCEDAPLPQTTLFTQARPLGVRLCTQEVQVSPSLEFSFDFSRKYSERTSLNIKVHSCTCFSKKVFLKYEYDQRTKK